MFRDFGFMEPVFVVQCDSPAFERVFLPLASLSKHLGFESCLAPSFCSAGVLVELLGAVDVTLAPCLSGF